MPSTDPASRSGFENVRPTLYLGAAAERSVPLSEKVAAADVALPFHGRAHAEIHLVNWTDGTFAANLALGDRVVVGMGEGGAQVLDGEITGIEERYGDGAPMLVLLLEDRLHRLARTRHSRRFEPKSATRVIEDVVREANLSPDVAVSDAVAPYLQMNESDLAFLMRLSAAFGIALRLEGETVLARPEAEDPEPIRLDPGDGTARRVRIVTDLNHQPTELVVKGFDLSSDEAVSHTISALEPAPSGTTAASALGNLGITTQSVMPHPFARRQGEAEAMANGQFARAARRFLAGEIVCDGAAGLRSGREVELSGVSPRLRGRYRIVDCRHRFGAAGYETVIRVERPAFS